MTRRLPSDAFQFYVSQGENRSYQAVADHFDVAKITVTRRAKAEGWQERLRELDAKARERSGAKALEAMEVVRERQLKSARMLQAKALEALRSLPPERAMRAAQMLSIGWKHELLLLGEPTERQATVEETIKREYQRWMVPDDDEGDEDNEDDDEDDNESDDVAQGGPAGR